MKDPKELAILRGLEAFQKAQQAHAEKRYEEAVKLYNKALALMPDNPKVLLEFSRLTMEVKDWTASETIFRKIGALRPNSGYEGHLGEALFRQGKFAEAIPLFRKHLESNPRSSDVMHGLSNALCSLGQWNEGLVWAERAWALQPKAKYLDSVLNTLYHLARVDDLEKLAPEAVRQFPDSPEVRSMYALHKLKSGDLAEGFKYYADFRWRNNINMLPGVQPPVADWDGQYFDGVLLATSEQGLGDELMASSTFEDLVAMGQQAMIECDARLIPIYQRAFPQLTFVPRGQGILHKTAAGEGMFRRVNVLDLIGFFRTKPGSFPARQAWLKPDPDKVAVIVARYRQAWPGKKLVGISWKSQRIMEGGEAKGVKATDFAPVLAVPGCVFINLQYGDVSADLEALREAGLGEVYVDPEVDTTNDLDTLLAQIAALDVVVSTSNTTVHLAGAQGAPCYVLLPKVRPSLWYWGYAGEQSVWYPALHLLRNRREDHWQELMREAAARITDHAADQHG